MNNHRPPANELSVRGYHQLAEHSTLLARHKESVGSSLNTSLSNWRGRVGKPSDPPKPSKRVQPQPAHRQIEIKLSRAPERPLAQPDFRGMTLQQYFRVQSSCKTEGNGPVEGSDKEQILGEDPPAIDSLQINETDEDRYNESAQSIHTPDFNGEQIRKPHPTNNTQQRILDKYCRVPVKLKTEVEEEQDYGQVFGGAPPKRPRLPSVIETQSRTLRVDDPLHEHRRKRTISNPHQQPKEMRFTFNDFYRGEHQRKERVLQKVQKEKKVAELRINELCMVTKYAQRFNINDAICRQIIREGRY